MAKKHSLTEEDKALFRSAMDDLPTEDDSLEFDDADSHTPHTHFTPINLRAIPDDEWLGPAAVMTYFSANLSTRQHKALKRGTLAIERRLDCHGLRVEEACDTLNDAFDAALASGDRYLLIIHGKGFKSGEKRAGQLKNLLNQALRSNPNVLAFHSAQAKHGGTGALYVLLKSHKQ